MNKLLRNEVGHIIALFLFLVQYKSASSLHLEADLIPLVRNARQADAGCKLPPFPANGHYSMNGGDATPGQTVDTFTIIDLECDFGYKASATVAFCQPTNTWSRQWQCERLESGCVVPDPPENGSHELETKETLSPGIKVEDYTVLHYSCNAGYNLTATSSLSVCINGVWSSNPKCESRGCVLPKMPANGAYVIQSNNGVFTPGSFVEDLTILEYTCNKGYAVTKNTSVCQRPIWTSTPVCEKLCKKLKSNSVSLSCNPDMEEGCPVGSVIIPVCKTGYNSNRTLETMTCLGGTWDFKKPKCEQITCELMTSNTVNFTCYDSDSASCSNKIGDGKTVYFSCKEGHSRVEGNNGGMLCRGGQWNIPIPQCSPIKSKLCKNPESDSVSLACNPVMEEGCPDGSLIIPICKAGYSSNRTLETMTCLGGTWDLQTPKCELKLCKKPVSDSVSLACNPVMDEGCPDGSVIIPVCKAGYSSNRTLETMTCLGGSWDLQTPKCELITCELKTSNTVNFKCYDSDSAIPCSNKIVDGKTVYFSCKEGYSRVEGNNGGIFCRGGQWDIPVPLCSPKLCKKPVSDSVSLACNPVMDEGCPDGSVIIPVCKAGYSSNRTLETMTCLGGSWDLQTPKCELITCELKTSNTVNFVCYDSHSASCSNKIVDGKTVNFSCKEGYSRAEGNNGGMLCRGGQWNIPIPRCSPKLCKKPVSDSVSLACNPVMDEGCPDGSVIIPVCKAGYSSNRTLETMTCLGGTWDLQTPKCELITCELETSNTVNFRCYDSRSTSCSNKIGDGKTVDFTCKQGYSRAEGNNGRMLCRGGQWNKPIPSCSPKLCKKPESDSVSLACNPVMEEGCPDRSVIIPVCKAGYSSNRTLETMTCLGGTWDLQTPKCELELCKKPESDSVSLACNPVMEEGCPDGSVIIPVCKAGYSSNRTLKTMTCLGGTWDLQTPKCELATCELKRSYTVNFRCYDSHSTSCSNKIADGKTVDFTCKRGYSRVGGNNGGMLCKGGQWNIPIPQCSPITCELQTSNTVNFMCYDSHSAFCSNTIVNRKTVSFSCKEGYSRVEGNRGWMQCRGGQWNIPIPSCSPKLCKKPESDSVSLACNPVVEEGCPDRSVIIPVCKAGYSSNRTLETMTCLGGTWDIQTPKCELKNSSSEVQIVNGFTVKKDTFPWHVEIFQRDVLTNAIQQICGGSIIRANIVISAAHCFFDQDRLKQIDARYYKVAAGKFLRSWNNDLPENVNFVQKSDVTAIYLPRGYGGDEQNQQSDLALLHLATPFRLENSVRAVSYELYDASFDAIQTQPGSLGKVVGWGRTDNGEPSWALKTLELPVIGIGECHKEMSKYHFSRYLTTDKLCAGHLNGRALCRGDGGGGLVFPAEDKEGNIHWYLRGVVSKRPLNDAKTSCQSNTYTTFTHIFKMRDWLNWIIGSIPQPVAARPYFRLW